MTITEVQPSDLPCPGSSYFTFMDTVLDVGSAYAPQAYVPYGRCDCLEPHPIYIDLLRRDYGSDPRISISQLTWKEWYNAVDDPDDLYDCVTGFDVIEHMTKEDGLTFLRQAKMVARKQVIVHTPLGFYPQNYDDPLRLLGGRPGLHWQTHKSGWLPEDFGPDWDIVFANNAYRNDGNGNPGSFGLLWAFWNRKSI